MLPQEIQRRTVVKQRLCSVFCGSLTKRESDAGTKHAAAMTRREGSSFSAKVFELQE